MGRALLKTLPEEKNVLFSYPQLLTIFNQGGELYKYYELEQYEEALAKCKYINGDLFNSPLTKGGTAEGRTGYLPGRSPYQEYIFMKDEKMLKALVINYENNKVTVDLTKLYPNIDIAETLSNLTANGSIKSAMAKRNLKS